MTFFHTHNLTQLSVLLFLLLGLSFSQRGLAQIPTIDRVVQEQTLRDAMQLSKPKAKSARQEGRKFSEEEMALLDREFGQQQITGIIQPQNEFLLMLEQNGNYTTNAGLVNSPRLSDWIMRPSVRAFWTPEITENLSLLAMSYYSLWRYERAQFLNFDDFGSQFGLIHLSGAKNLPGGMTENSGWLQYRYQRQFQPGNWGQGFYDSHFLETGMRRVWRIAPKVAGWIGTNAAFSLEGRPDVFRRHEFSAQTGCQWEITPRLSLTGLYRFAWFKVIETTRDDNNHLFALNLNYQFNKYLQASISSNFIFNNSDVNLFDYQAFNGGLGASLTVSW